MSIVRVLLSKTPPDAEVDVVVLELLEVTTLEVLELEEDVERELDIEESELNVVDDINEVDDAEDDKDDDELVVEVVVRAIPETITPAAATTMTTIITTTIATLEIARLRTDIISTLGKIPFYLRKYRDSLRDLTLPDSQLRTPSPLAPGR